MATEWEPWLLGQLYEFRSGLSKPRSEFGSGYPFLSFKDVFYNFFVPDVLTERVKSTERERRVCSIRLGDVFLTRTSETFDELGMSCVALQDYNDATFNGFTKRLRPNSDRILPEFAGYLFRGPEFRRGVTAMSSLSTRASLNNEMLSRLTVRVPPKKEQAAIAAILKPIDDKVELNRRISETLEEIARTIFKSWFIDFDPVRAVMERRRSYGMDGDIAALFPDSFVDSEVGDIPRGWRWRNLGEIARVNARTLTAKDDLDPVMYVDISSASRGEVSEIATFDRGTEPSRARRRPSHGDTVLSTVRPERGSYFLCMDPPGNLVVSTGFATITPLKVPWTFLHAAVTGDDVFEYLGHIADGAAYPAVRSSVIENLEIVVPDRPELLDAYHQLCDPMFRLADANRQESKTIASLRDSLLPKLISGEIRIKDAERMAEATLDAVS